jgi:parallel beta-helix repeat protein
MRIRFLAIILISFLGIFNFHFKNSVSAETISVCSSGCNYSTIGEAVNQAKAGDLILVEDGSYNESVTIDKPLIIKSKNGPEKCTVYHFGFPFIISTTSVQIEGFTLIGTSMWGYWGSAGGVFINGNNNTIINNVFLNSDYGIFLKDANKNVIKDNVFKNINHGVWFFSSSSENEISNNSLETNTDGITLYYSSNNNKIENNTISAKRKYGIWILNSRNNYLSNNILTNSGIFIGGGSIEDYFQEIDESNEVNGKSLYYCKNKENETVPEAGQAILVNCKNIFIENQQTANLPAAIEIVSSSDIMINNSVLNNNDYGIFVFSSKNIVIENSSFQNNWQSVVLENSNNSTIKNNNFSFDGYSLTLIGSNWNIIQNNIFKNNFYALIISGSESNKIDYNQFISNNLAIFLKSGSKRNEIIHNNLKENQNALYLYDLPTKENSIYLNNFIKNASDLSISSYGIVLWNSKGKINYTFKGLSFSNYLGNYWDKYKGQDENKDGIGDTTFEIAPLWGAYKDEYPLIEPFENYFPSQKWKFENEFLLDLDGNSKTVEGKGYALGNVYLSEIEQELDALKIEGRISLEGSLPNQIPKIYLIATDGMDKEIASTSIPFNLISYSQIDEKVYSFSLSLLNPPKPINGGHYEVYLELGNNPLLINTTSKISKYYFPLIYLPEKKVLIYEVYYDVATGRDPDNEWIILHNLEDESVDISGWKIVDNYATDTIPQSSIIPANGFAIITASSTTFNLWKIPKGMTKIVLGDKRIGNGLANSGDRVILKDKEGNVVDAMSYGDDKTIFDNPPKARKGYSLLRDPPEKDTDTAEDFIESEPTIGKNQPLIPIINFSPKNPIKGVKVKFDASSSTDPDGEIVNFEWQIGTSTLTGTTTEFTFKENGEYQITLTVTDNDGATSSTSTTIKVEPFSFAIITDLHIGRHYQEEYEGQDYYLTERLKRVVKWINDNKDHVKCDENTTCSIKFLAVLGDITENTPLVGFCKVKEILDQLQVPYVLVFGNHDVGTDEEYEQFSRWKGQDYFDQVFWSTSSIPCQNATSTKNFELLLSELNFQRDETNKDYKNFSFSFGGINFIGLDFVSRKPFMKFGKGVSADAVLDEINKGWLEKKLEEFKGEPTILFAHHPFYKRSMDAFEKEEFEQIWNILENQNVVIEFGGHIHSFEEWHGKFAPANANIKYDPVASTNVLTTEALMVGSNGRGIATPTSENGVVGDKKGIVRIAKVFEKNNINPYNWETTEKGDEFLAFNPSLNLGFSIRRQFNNIPCVELEARKFSEKPCNFLWSFGGKTSSVDCNSDFSECLVCYEEGGEYTITLFAKDKNSNFTESISKKTTVNETIIPRTIKKSAELIEKGIEFISEKAQMGFDKIGQVVKDKVKIFKKKSPVVPVGEITVHFENLNEDLDLSGLVADTDFEKQKAILYIESWSNEIERSKILFLPKK